jgi:MFS superfamily sulfate permease-like transporter
MAGMGRRSAAPGGTDAPIVSTAPTLGRKVDSVEAVRVQRAEPSGLRRYVSVLEGIRPYQRGWLQSDIVAGVTLAALAIPETMGYTKIAGMPVITGLYTILIPIAAFALLGSSRHLVVGADSATAAIMFAGITSLGISGLQPATPQWVALAGLSALLAGGLLWLARVARLGFLADFLSRTVLVGFLTGVGIQVATGQVGGMLGIPKQTSGVPFVSGTWSSSSRPWATSARRGGRRRWSRRRCWPC